MLLNRNKQERVKILAFLTPIFYYLLIPLILEYQVNQSRALIMASTSGITGSDICRYKRINCSNRLRNKFNLWW